MFNVLINNGSLTRDQVNECLSDCNMDYRVEYGGMGEIKLYKLEKDEVGDFKPDAEKSIDQTDKREGKSMKKIFIGSSTRGIKHAEALKKNLESELEAKGMLNMFTNGSRRKVLISA